MKKRSNEVKKEVRINTEFAEDTEGTEKKRRG